MWWTTIVISWSWTLSEHNLSVMMGKACIKQLFCKHWSIRQLNLEHNMPSLSVKVLQLQWDWRFWWLEDQSPDFPLDWLNVGASFGGLFFSYWQHPVAKFYSRFWCPGSTAIDTFMGPTCQFGWLCSETCKGMQSYGRAVLLEICPILTCVMPWLYSFGTFCSPMGIATLLFNLPCLSQEKVVMVIISVMSWPQTLWSYVCG